MILEEALEITRKSLEKNKMIPEAFSYGYLYAVEEALEKQIAQKPILSADGYADGALVYDIAECPNCGHELDFEGQEHHCVCGQRIDWS